ncbi:MAG: hypothetical protein IPL47_06295 [Phyllobacteriaceae bacterium]|nr:hypothetical protein [Phyllobacteriaceae bacterium]
MSLPVLVALVVGGISAIVVLLHLTGGTRDARLADAEAARARFAADFLEETAERIVLAGDGNAAFLVLSGGRTGIVQAFGDRYLTRIHAPGEDDIAPKGEADLALSTHEFAWRGGTYRFASAAERDAVAARLAGKGA